MSDCDTLSESMNALREEGYTVDFNLDKNCLICADGRYRLMPDEFNIDKYFRFEGMTDPGDESILYAISSEKHNIKGVFVNGYGIYSDAIASEMIDKLKVH